MVEASPQDELLHPLRRPWRLQQERMQLVLLGLRRQRALLVLPPRPQGSPCRPDTEVVVPQCDKGLRGVEIYRHFLHPNLHHQQRQDRLPQREAAAETRQGRHQHLRNLRPQSLGLLQVLLHWLQARRHADGPGPHLRPPSEARPGLDADARLGVRRVLDPKEGPEDVGLRPAVHRSPRQRSQNR